MPNYPGPTGRVVAVLDRMAAEPLRTFTLSELSRELGISKATLHALVRTLSAAGYLLHSPVARGYSLGPALVRLGGAAAGARAMALEVATPVAIELSKDFGECIVSAAQHGSIAILARAVNGALEFGAFPYQPPLAAPVGSVFIAWGDDDTVDAWLAHLGENSDADRRARMVKVLDSVRDRGYAISLGTDPRQELANAIQRAVQTGDDIVNRDGVAALLRDLDDHHYLPADLSDASDQVLDNLAAPVFDSTGAVVVALTIKGFPLMPVPGAYIESAARRLLSATRSLSAALSTPSGVTP